jgi:hypothetical protein
VAAAEETATNFLCVVQTRARKAMNDSPQFRRDRMRSDRIVKTFDMGQNRFELCHQTFKAIRKLHNPGHRIQDTTNDALQRLAGARAADIETTNPEQPDPSNEA